MIKDQLNHRTIREFEQRPVEEEKLKQLLDVANRAPSSMGLQAYSIIRVTDKKLKEELTKISTQEYLNRTPELFIFVLDIFRNSKILHQKLGHTGMENDMDKFFQGFTDALLAAQNMYNAIEEMGMGAVYFGSILNDYDRVIELLSLPMLTFPVVGLGFGYPAQDPQLKPRMSMDLKVFENSYEIFDDYLDAIKDYDEEMTHYYDTRENGRRSDSFSKQVAQKYQAFAEKRANVMKSIERQGFKFRLEK